LSDNVLVVPPPAQTQTASGIILPETAAQEKPQQGSVVAVGPGRTLESGEVVPMLVKVGDSVVYGAYAGIEFKVGNQTYFVIRQDDILLLEEEEKPDAQDANG
jgi:chaperonin GroES